MGTDLDDLIQVTVHGDSGALDLMVPAESTARDVATAYAHQAAATRTPARAAATALPVPALHTLSGQPLRPGDLASALRPGQILVAVYGAPAPAPGSVATPPPREASPGTARALTSAAAVAAGFGTVLALSAGPETRLLVATMALIAAGLGVLPIGRAATARAAVAPAFAASAAILTAWSAARPLAEQWPVLLTAGAAAMAVAAAVARAFVPSGGEPQLVWVGTGTVLALAGGAALLLDISLAATCSVLVALAMIAARWVPALAVDAPDTVLVDADRLGVRTWALRARPVTAPPEVDLAAVAATAQRGQRLVDAAAVATALVLIVASAVLLTVTGPDLADVDRIGTRLLVGFTAGAFVFAGGTHRATWPRRILRGAGVFTGGWLMISVLLTAQSTELFSGAAVAVLIGSIAVGSAVLTGRGWRSVGWARRAEVLETLCAALAIVAVVVSTGLFRYIWELTSR